MKSSKKYLTEFQTKKLLGKFNIPITQEEEAETAEEAFKASARIGLPVALKISHPEITHKSDIGGVYLNISSENEAYSIANRLLTKAKGAKVLVQEMAPKGGCDLIVGLKRDPVFGAVIILGIGGIYAELFADTALEIGDLDEKKALAMIERLKGKSILEGARGTKPLDKNAIVNALLSLSTLATERPDILELDVNPLRVYEKGALALDAMALVDGEYTPVVKISKPININERVDRFFKPNSVAVVGPSTSGEKAGNVIIKNLKTFGYKGAIYPVNPGGKKIEGLKSYPAVSKCPSPVQLAIIAVPYRQVKNVLADVAASGTKHAIVVSGGFSDAGEEGRLRENALLDFCKQYGINLMGPNSIGTIDARFGFCSSIGKLPPMPPSGISLFGQSGVFSTGFSLEEITYRKRGFAKVACIGNKADMDESDLLEYLAEDDDTRCIGIYIESVKDGARFIEAAQRASQNKPCVILKSGRTKLGARAAASHTGSLAGSDMIYDAVFRKTGLLRVEDFRDFFDALRAFDICPLPSGNRIGIVSMTGVGCVLAADACGRFGMELATLDKKTLEKMKTLAPEWAQITNPADIWSTIERMGAAEAYRRLSEIMMDDENVDILIVISVLLAEGAFDVREPFRYVKERYPAKPILACYVGGRKDLIEDYSEGFESLSIPVYDSPESAVKAASFLYRRKLIENRLHP
ncbi:MAG: acetate--CoA ligase family protein [Myxococcota bacterium]